MVLVKTCVAAARLASSAGACKARRVKVSQPWSGICTNAGKPQNTMLEEVEDAAKWTDHPYLEAPPHTSPLLSNHPAVVFVLPHHTGLLSSEVPQPSWEVRFCTTTSCTAVLQTLPSLSGKFSPVSCMQAATAKPHQKTASRPACARVPVTSHWRVLVFLFCLQQPSISVQFLQG